RRPPVDGGRLAAERPRLRDGLHGLPRRERRADRARRLPGRGPHVHAGESGDQPRRGAVRPVGRRRGGHRARQHRRAPGRERPQALHDLRVAGTRWDAGEPPLELDTAASGYPHGNNAVVFPWVVAGGDGLVDVAWYGAHGGSASYGDDRPNDDPANLWHVYLAQTIDGGRSW